MKLSSFFKSFKGNEALLRKLNVSNWSPPQFEQVLPYFISGLGGFVLASLTGLVAAAVFMPKPSALGVTQDAPQDGSVLRLQETPNARDFRPILARNVFDHTRDALEEAPAGEVAGACGEMKKSDLPLKLTGLIFGGTAAASLVVLESTSNRQAESYLLNDSLVNIAGEPRISNIERERVILMRNGCEEFLDLERAPLPTRRTAGARPARGSQGSDLQSSLGGDGFTEEGFERRGGEINVSRQWIDRALTSDFTRTLQDAKATPNMEGNQIRGFYIDRIKPDSVYEKMGLQDGDIIDEINGIELNDAARAIQTLNAMRDETTLELRFRRNGKTETMKIQVK